MSEDFVRTVLKEQAETGMPGMKDPWPAIRDRVQPGQLEHNSGSSPQLAKPVLPQPQTTGTPRIGRTATTSGMSRLRVNMAMALIGLLALTAASIVAVTGDRFQPLLSQSAESAFLPTGKVRHVVLTGTYTVEGGIKNTPAQSTEQHREEFWLTEGKSHPLMRNIVTVPITAMTWLDEDAYYEYNPAQGNQVRRYPYDPKYLEAVVPDPEIVTKTLRMQDAHLIGNDSLDGRGVVVITISNSNAPRSTSTTKDGPPYTTTTVTYWIDRKTNQLIQNSSVVTTVGGPQNGLVQKAVNKTALDELKDRSEFPADFFKFSLPQGAIFGEQRSVSPASTPVSTP